MCVFESSGEKPGDRTPVFILIVSAARTLRVIENFVLSDLVTSCLRSVKEQLLLTRWVGELLRWPLFAPTGSKVEVIGIPQEACDTGVIRGGAQRIRNAWNVHAVLWNRRRCQGCGDTARGVIV